MGNLTKIHRRRTFPWFALMMSSNLGLGIAAFLAIWQDSYGMKRCVYTFDCETVLSVQFLPLSSIHVMVIGLLGYFVLSTIMLRILGSIGNTRLIRWVLFITAFFILMIELGMSLSLSVSQILTIGVSCGLCHIHLIPALIGTALGFVVFNDLMSNSIWKDDVFAALKKIKVSSEVLTREEVEKSTQAELRIQLGKRFVLSEKEGHIVVDETDRYVDIVFDDSNVGIELKVAKSLNKNRQEARRLVRDQVPDYKTVYKSNLIVAIAGVEEEFEHKNVLWVFRELRKLDTPYVKIPIVAKRARRKVGFPRKLFGFTN